MTRARGWAWRAVLSALAGGGLAGLGGPLASGALAADTPVSAPSPGEGSTAPITTPTPATPAAATGTSETAAQPANTSTTSTPQPSTPQPASTPATGVVEVPTVVVQRQRRQKTT